MKTNEKGVTLISLTVTIIVLIILASVGVTSGISTINSSKLTKFTAEMKAMQEIINELYNSWKVGDTVTTYRDYNGDEILNMGKDLLSVQQKVQQVFKSENEGGSGITNTDGYRYFDNETIRYLFNKEMQQEFFVNIKERKIISTEGIKYNGKICYTIKQLPDGVYNVEYDLIDDAQLDFDISGKYVYEESGRIDISNIIYYGPVNKWQVRYRLKGKEEWQKTEEFLGDEISITVRDMGTYEVQVYHGEEIISEIKEITIEKS